MVVFTSDHGEMAGCHGRFGKSVMHDESVRVPLFVRAPGGVARATRLPVCTMDLHASLLDWAGVSVPDDAEGRSLVPCVAGQDLPVRDLFIEDHQDCIVRGETKLVVPRDGTRVEQCYDLARDPFELDNLAGALDPALEAGLLAALEVWRNRTRAGAAG